MRRVIEGLTTAAEHDANGADRLERRRVLEPNAGRFVWFLNALSHPAEIVPLRDLPAQDGRFAVTTPAIGKGELVATRAPRVEAIGHGIPETNG